MTDYQKGWVKVLAFVSFLSVCKLLGFLHASWVWVFAPITWPFLWVLQTILVIGIFGGEGDLSFTLGNWLKVTKTTKK